MLELTFLLLGYLSVIIGNFLIAFQNNKKRKQGFVICIIGNISFIIHACFIQYTDIVFIFPIYLFINLFGYYNSNKMIQSR